MSNRLVAEHLRLISLMYNVEGEYMRGRAYANASEAVKNHKEELIAGRMPRILAVGNSIEKTICAFLVTGSSARYRMLAERVDPQMLTMLIVKGIGPKIAKSFYDSGIKNFDELVKANEEGKIDPKFSASIKQAQTSKGERINHRMALAMGEAILGKMKSLKETIRAEIAGSIRRKKESSKDLDIVCSSENPEKLLDVFCSLGDVINRGEHKAFIWFTLDGKTIQADLLVVDDDSFGAAIQYFTGSKEHNIEVRKLAQSKGMKVNEKGIFRGEEKLGGKNERDIYDILEIPMPEPWER